MAVRTDFTFDFGVSPRIITIADPSVTVTVQDLYDTLADQQALIQNIDDLILIKAAGKAALGGSKFTGVTVTLQDCQIAFEERTTPVDTGTATTANAAGTTLIDSAATFQTTGILKGDIIVNFTDQSMASVLTIDSELQITHTVLSGGTDNDWDVPDAYGIYRVAVCTVTDGDLVAIDSGASALDPIFPTFGTRVTIELSTSPALITTAGGAGADWTTAEIEQIRSALGITGTKTAAVGGQLQVIDQAVVDKLRAEVYDTVTFDSIMQIILAMAAGRIRQIPGTDDFQFYKRDNTTILYTLRKTIVATADERVRL